MQNQLPKNLTLLAEELAKVGQLVDLPIGFEVLKEEQYVKSVPILLSGLVKVVTRGEYKDLLLYYIKPGESCMMSFIHALHQNPSTVYAIVEEPTSALLIPSTALESLISTSPEFNQLFHQLANQRYTDLLSTINAVFFDNLDTRLLNYLKEKARLSDSNTVHVTHQQIANDLGTAREVISRVLKKLDNEGFILNRKEKISLM
ncbi:Crp/Fnr family transcriptional regulator [Roseivirga sp.]|uniref:Crp/Fnr family transcriptional regulator n=1 Tax=Roseivirga sp. TaxID=1964215 RepID=UPI003BAB2FD3